MQDAIPDRTDMPGEPNCETILEGIRQHVSELSAEDIPTDYFTPHDGTHCQAVEKMVNALITDMPETKLTSLEQFLLVASVWTHDIGMLDRVARDRLKEEYSTDKKRDMHEQISAWYINNNDAFRRIFTSADVSSNLFQNYAHTMSIISKFHRRRENVAECPTVRIIKGQHVRMRLLACLLRLGDTLHMDSSRFDSRLYQMLQIGTFNRSARLHWLKSYLVSNVHLDRKKQEIVVTIDLPDPVDDQDRIEMEENADRLQKIIRDDVYEDIQAVGPTMKDCHNAFYSSVRVQVDYCQGYSDAMREEVHGILNDIAILLSPNASGVIDKALDSIVSLSRTEFTDFDRFANSVESLINQIKRVHRDRPGDVALSGIIAELVKQQKTFSKSRTDVPNADIEALQEKLRAAAERMRTKRRGLVEKIATKGAFALADKSNILLFGFSEIVLEVLKQAASSGLADQGSIFVFECSGKRQLSLLNDIEYNDGINYALAVWRLGYKDIWLLPDTSFASLLNDKKRGLDPSRTVLLIGANGVEICGGAAVAQSHSSGHLMMTIVAKHFHVPVVVVADKFKCGTVDWENLNVERRGNSWLSGKPEAISELQNRGIKCFNYRADRVEANCCQIILD